MKIRVIGLLFIVMMTMVGCSSSNDVSSDENVHDEDGTQRSDVLDMPFDTYKELEAFFLEGETGIPAMENAEEYGEEYIEFVMDMVDGDIKLVMPYINDELMDLREEEHFPNIYFTSEELYGRPWIWYFCKVEDMDCRIRIMYLSEEENAYAKEHTIDEMCQYMSPKAPSLDERWKFWEYEDISIEEMQFSDRIVSVLSVKKVDDERVYKKLIYDNLYVRLVGYEEVFDASIWEGFSLRQG